MIKEDDAYISDFPEDFPKDATKEKMKQGMTAKDIIDKRLMHLNSEPSKESQQIDHRDRRMSNVEEHKATLNSMAKVLQRNYNANDSSLSQLELAP